MPIAIQVVAIALSLLLLAVFALNLADFAREILRRQDTAKADAIRVVRVKRVSGAANPSSAAEDGDQADYTAEETGRPLSASRSELARGMAWSFILEPPRADGED